MKKQMMIIGVSALTFTALAQDPGVSSEVPRPDSSNHVEQQTNELKPRREKEGDPSPHDKVEKKRAKQQRRLQLMERELNKIGVTDEEKAQVSELQKMHNKKMMANSQRTEMAREKLSKLLDEGASMELLEAAIQDVSAAQTEQLRILVNNRIEMERILGREKYAQFMQNARVQFKKHGRHGGPPLPPRPSLPPTPGQEPIPPTPPVVSTPPVAPTPPEN